MYETQKENLILAELVTGCEQIHLVDHFFMTEYDYN